MAKSMGLTIKDGEAFIKKWEFTGCPFMKCEWGADGISGSFSRNISYEPRFEGESRDRRASAFIAASRHDGLSCVIDDTGKLSGKEGVCSVGAVMLFDMIKLGEVGLEGRCLAPEKGYVAGGSRVRLRDGVSDEEMKALGFKKWEKGCVDRPTWWLGDIGYGFHSKNDWISFDRDGDLSLHGCEMRSDCQPVFFRMVEAGLIIKV